MEYRPIGENQRLSTIGIGSAMIHELSAVDVETLFSKAVTHGVNFIDLAMSYEEPLVHIGKALKDKRDQFFLQLHLGLTFTRGQYKKTWDIELVRHSFEKQLNQLELDYVDIGCIHYIDDMADFEEVISSGVYAYAKSLKWQGKIKYLGIASHVAEICHRFIELGDIDFIMFSVNPAYDLNPVSNLPFEGLDMKGITIERAVEERHRLYEVCEQESIGIIAMKTLAGGILQDEQQSPLGKAMTVNQCIQYALDRPGVLSCPVTVNSVEALDEVVKYYEANSEERAYDFILKS